MNGINIYTQNKDNINLTAATIKKTNEDLINKKTKDTNKSLDDEIKISKTNDLVVNTKKAYDAFRDTCKEIGETSWNGYGAGDMSLAFFTIVDIMESHGVKVPNYAFNSNDKENLTNNNDFLGFVDKMEQYVKNDSGLSINYPTKFFDFTKLYKEKLVQYGCK